MTPAQKQNLYFVLSLLLAIWFACTAALWTYLANVVVALPAGILSAVFWQLGRKIEPRRARFRVIPIIWTLGCIISLVALTFILLYDQ